MQEVSPRGLPLPAWRRLPEGDGLAPENGFNQGHQEKRRGFSLGQNRLEQPHFLSYSESSWRVPSVNGELIEADRWAWAVWPCVVWGGRHRAGSLHLEGVGNE